MLGGFFSLLQVNMKRKVIRTLSMYFLYITTVLVQTDGYICGLLSVSGICSPMFTYCIAK